jgi:hypothetical protein
MHRIFTKTLQKQKRTFEKNQGLLRIFKDFWGFSGTFGDFGGLLWKKICSV